MASITVQRCILLRADDARHAALDDPGLFASDLGQGLAQILLMIQRNRRDERQRGAFNDVGRIQPPAQPDLKQGVIRGCPGKGQQRGTGRDLEIGDVLAAIRALAFLQNLGQRGLR